ncbi:MAG: flagellar basal-body rod protein FlgF [Thermodesulfobacteriota bacterium]|nr:flagellar basal-body rod protein FlgF [Thermodesulfobacteriota bacterium]
MQQSMYSALFGAMTQEHRLDIIANNLANVNTSGYKTNRLSFKDTFIRYAHDNIREPLFHLKSEPLFPEPDYIVKPRIAVSQVDFSQGSFKRSDNPLDLGIAGEGFFKVRTQTGDYYSRNGNFHVTAQGLVANGNGDLLLGEGGPVAVPPNGEVVINSGGEIYVNNEQVGQINLVTVSDLNALEKLGNNLFRLREGSGAGEQPAEEAELKQGYLEAPNVEVVNEMVNMIEAQRAFGAYSKVIQMTQEADTKVISQVGTVR